MPNAISNEGQINNPHSKKSMDIVFENGHGEEKDPPELPAICGEDEKEPPEGYQHHSYLFKELPDITKPETFDIDPNLIPNLEQSMGDVYCDGPGTRTRSKMGQEPIVYNEKPLTTSTPSFLVQIPFYAYKKENNRKCSVCGKHGRTPSDLLRHMRVHTGERPFPCTSCDKKFKCKRSQLTHQYLTHDIKDGLSSHRLQILELKKMRHRSSKVLSKNYDMPPVLENQVIKEKMGEANAVDQDEDTEIVDGEDAPASNGELKTNFEGIFSSQLQSGEAYPILSKEGKQEYDLQGFGVVRKSPTPVAEIVTNVKDEGLQTWNQNLSTNSPKIEQPQPAEADPPRVPILRIKTHKCTHCKRQFRSIYTLRYHLRSMHGEKVYLSPALEMRLKRRRWLPPHARLQKSKLLSLSSVLINKALAKSRASSSAPTINQKEDSNAEAKAEENITKNVEATEQVAETFNLDQTEQNKEDSHQENNRTKETSPPDEKVTFASIKTEKPDPVHEAIANNKDSNSLNGDIAAFSNCSSSTLRNILTSKESLFNHLHNYPPAMPPHIPVTSGSSSYVNSKASPNSYLVPPHIFLPSNSQIDEGLENNKPVSWESLQVTSENVLVTKMEAIHPTSQQKYVLYKCSQCGKAYSGLRAISVHLASHHDSTGKDCDKCGASFKWQNELDTHLECHRSDRKYMPTSPFLPSYYVNPFPIPVLPANEQAVMPTTAGLLSYPFFPMPQQISPLVQPGFFPFFAAAVQPQSQVQLGENNGTATSQMPSHPPQDKSKESPDEKNVPQNCTFQCKLCPKTFDRIFSLQRHERIHSGVKACFCKTCGRGFSELRNLRHHIVRFHADTAKMEPLPYRRQPTRVRSSSQRLVSFLKKTAVRILNSMGQSKLDSPPSSVKVQTEEDLNESKSQQDLMDNVPENLSNSQKVPQATSESVDKQGLNSVDQFQVESKPATSQSDSINESFASTQNRGNYLQVPELNDLPTINGSPIVSDSSKTSQAKNCSRPMEVLQDPKRSLMGNRRKGRPFKLATASCNFLSPIGDDNLYAITQKILNGMPKLNVEAPVPFLQTTTTPTPQAAGSRNAPTDLSMPQLSFFNPEPSMNEPIDMTNVKEVKASLKETKLEPSVVKTESSGVAESTTVPQSFPSFGLLNTTTLNTKVKSLSIPDEKCMFPCSYCHRNFSSLSDLNRHMTFHADIRPFKCPYCSYCSRTNSQLKVHMMRHEGIKHYMCQICNYNGVTQSDLNRHLKTRTHLLRSRNVCACCGTGFHTRSLSEEHYKSCRMLAKSGNPEQSVNSQGRLNMENKNRGNRLKHVPKPNKDDQPKTDFYQKICDLRKMGIPFTDFLHQNTATNAVK